MFKKTDFFYENRKLTKSDVSEISEWIKKNDVNKTLFSDNHTLLWHAVRDSALEVVDFLVKHGADISLCGEYKTLIEVASIYGNLNVIKYFLDNGFDRETFFKDDSLIYAAEGNFVGIIKYLVEQGKDIEKRLYDYSDGCTALRMASQVNSIESVELLCKLGANVNADSIYGTPIYIAALEGNFEVVKILLKYGANINYITEDGSTAYEAAIYNRHNDIAEYLLKNGADPNLAFIKRGGKIPSIWYACASKKEAYEAAIENSEGKPIFCDGECHMDKIYYKNFKREKADVINKWLNDNDMPLPDEGYEFTWFEYAVLNDSTTETIKFLISLGISPYTSSSYEWNTIIEFAAMYGRLDVIKFLIENGYDHETFLKDDSLIFAASNDFTDIIEYMIKEGKDINQSFGKEKGYTALREAAYLNYTESVELLCKLGADVNISNKYDTPLYSAAAEGNLETVKILISYGADVNKASKYGITPYEISEKYGYNQVATYLGKHGAKN